MFRQWTHSLPDLGFSLRGWHTPPSGKPLIHFLHGNGFCGLTYEPMLRILAQDFDLWLSDIQGHGDSDSGARFLGWNHNAQLALETFQAQRQLFGPVPIFAVGHSFGGVLTALMLALARHPFQKAVLLDPVLFSWRTSAFLALLNLLGIRIPTPLAKATLRRRWQWQDRDEAFHALQGRGAYRGWREEALRAFVDHALRDGADGGVELKCPPSMEARIFSSGPRGLWASLRRIAVPTRIVYGQDTMALVRSSAPRAAAMNRCISAQQVPGGHCFMQEDPELAAAAVRDFLLGGQP